MRVFLTGGAGYIGGATAEALLAAGHGVTVYDNLSRGHRSAVPPGAEFVHGDIGDRDALNSVLSASSFDVVFHFAALIEAGESMEKPELYFRNNVSYSHNLIEAALQTGCRHFVLSSTAAVYASSDQPLHEDSALGPVNAYGETKLMIERMLYWYHQVHGMRYAVLRYFNACGALPGRGESHRPETHLIPRVMQVALGQREYIELYGSDYSTPDGSCIRDYIHIADLTEAHLLAAASLEQRETAVYNVGTGSGYSNREIIAMARKVTGHAVPVHPAPRRVGDAARLVAGSQKIRHELGWTAQHSALENILTTAWEWHRNHQCGYDSD
ncbi:MAG: UDP-glucose 4-epimerase GalE [Anaerolineales bacterium]|nr:UDP-glucose 4-epimerase GalE [Anaerolineales bacterium]